MPQRGSLGEKGVDMVIGIFLAILVGAAILPQALDDWFNASTGNWDSGVAALWPLVPLVALIAIVYLFYRRA